MKYILLLLFLLAHISCEKSGIETPIGFTVYKLESIYGGLSGQTILAQDLDFNEMIIIQVLYLQQGILNYLCEKMTDKNFSNSPMSIMMD